MTEARRPYELHRSLMTAFPDKTSEGSGHVLFRLDIDRESGSMSVLVQSEKEPDWARLNGATGFVTEYQSKPFDPVFAQGQVLRFRLRANPTSRVKETGKRQGILSDQAQMEWLCKKKASQHGFEIVEARATRDGLAEDKMTDRNEHEHNLTLLSVRFDGLLRVNQPDLFRQALVSGIGSAKGFGFGLLSVAPLRD